MSKSLVNFGIPKLSLKVSAEFARLVILDWCRLNLTTFNENIELLVAQTKSVRGALFALKNNIEAFGNCHLAYEYMLQTNAYIRGDHVSMTTLPENITDLYWPSGGSNADPVIENIGTLTNLMVVDLPHLCAMENSRFYNHQFFSALIEEGCQYLAAYPIRLEATDSFGALTVFESRNQRKSALDPSWYIEAAMQFHHALRIHGQMTHYFEINNNEKQVLEKMAHGKTTADIAQELNLTQRAVELRLQSARKKLKSRTTTEAVYKAITYSIIFR